MVQFNPLAILELKVKNDVATAHPVELMAHDGINLVPSDTKSPTRVVLSPDPAIVRRQNRH